jgi:hypothetical protein
MTSEPPLRPRRLQFRLTQDASFVLGFGGKLLAGHFTLLAQIIINPNATNAEIQRMLIEIASKS